MRVKRLEIQGFKSFKDRTVVHFDHSITGIVGPNGCGKSNIVDAFFWVMGEQSYKHMRGNSSDDLIFNGSSKYSPLGMAEATLVMEADVIDPTADAPTGATTQDIPNVTRTKEISVTRRLYRSGEGEYLINGTQARLKDIHELFMDTGVGAKGYSVIEQGQIGKIVNSKPEERRLLIEEAAGIAKYKARKKESLRKMEATQTNLSRLTDIIQEIEKNLGSLERQAQKARQYKKYKDELLDKEMTWGRRKNFVYQQKLDGLKKQRDLLEEELLIMRTQLQTAENSIEVDRVDLVSETKEAEDLQARIQDLSSDLSQEKSALELSRRRQGDLSSQLEALEVEQQELLQAIETDTEKLEAQAIESQEAEQLFHQAAQSVREMSQSLSELRRSVDQARAQVDSNQRDLMRSIHQASELTSRKAGLTSKAEASKIQAERLTEQTQIQNEKLISIEDELLRVKTSYEEVQSQKQTLLVEKKEHALGLQSQEQEIRELEKAKEQSLRSLTQLKSKLQSLEELNESHEGLADGAKAALDWAKASGKSNHLIALTDAIQVSTGYETVLESWLESRMDSLVATQPEILESLLNQIQNEKQGRVSIQLSTALAQKQPSENANQLRATLEAHGIQVLGALSDLITIQPEYQNTLSSLFHSVWVIENSAQLASLLGSGQPLSLANTSLVSMDGAVFESQGLIRGGSLKSSGAIGILRRKRSIEELHSQVAEAESTFESAEVALETAKETLEISKARYQTLQSELQELEVQAAGLQRDVHQTERALQDAKNHLSMLQKDIQSLEHESEKATEDHQHLETQLQDLLATRADLEEKISEFEHSLSEQETLYEEKDSELQGIRVQEASLRERAGSLKREHEATRSLKADRERRLTEVRKTLDRASREQEEFSGGETDLTQKIEELTLTLATQRERLAAVKDRMEQANAKVNHTLELIKTLHKQGDQKTAESNQLALEIEKLSSDLAHLVQNLEEKYGAGCLQFTLQTAETTESPIDSEAQPEAPSTPAAPPELTPEEEIALGEEVERLRERIRRLGEVNVMAIEEFEHLKKRYDHLLTERTDLEHSLNNLQSAIEHINQTSEERFKKAFEAIASRFERLFPIIFGGGQAKLSLVYPEGSSDILDAGVDILAQPPGKKVANITLLSGGEKALTAVSLIFAIFMVKPSPFCVLDEVDAPLDDANIGKFNALLREMSAKSQFILITHNKKTMELNDTLYGVTMEEPGVSKMVSIEMR